MAKISVFDEDSARRVARKIGMDPQVLRQVYLDFLKHGRGAAFALGQLAGDLRKKVKAEVDFHCLEFCERHDSQRDGASKLIFKTADGFAIETVILRVDSGRTSLCVSSQVGCAAGCLFCATGDMGISRNLSRDEILDQVAQANEILCPEHRSIRNVVFMGMGEPFHNEDAVADAVERLTAPRGFGFSAQKVLVSTVGEVEAMKRFARRFPAVNLALSLHAARDEVRRRLVPLAKKTSVSELKDVVRETGIIRQRPTMIEYVMLAGENDRDEDFEALVAWLQGLDVHVNLIPFNEGAASLDLRATPLDRCRKFSKRLKDRGFRVTLRYSLGADIAAACGQLVRSRAAGRGGSHNPLGRAVDPAHPAE
ncbi:MAG: 23S rRNA (adenine(2503)-C(2))-methyltransferase RlmN [Planctomycetota bacterium]